MQDTEALVRAAQEGNLAAFGQVYEEYYLRVYRYAAARVGQSAEAEDIAQEVFLKALNSLHRFKFTGPPFAAWLFRIAHNLIIDRARHIKSASAATSGPPTSLDNALAVAGDQNVEQQALLALDMEALREALGKVTKLQRQVVELRFYRRPVFGRDRRGHGPQGERHQGVAAFRVGSASAAPGFPGVHGGCEMSTSGMHISDALNDCLDLLSQGPHSRRVPRALPRPFR